MGTEPTEAVMTKLFAFWMTLYITIVILGFALVLCHSTPVKAGHCTEWEYHEKVNGCG